MQKAASVATHMCLAVTAGLPDVSASADADASKMLTGSRSFRPVTISNELLCCE
jgi:hypothetical protein